MSADKTGTTKESKNKSPKESAKESPVQGAGGQKEAAVHIPVLMPAILDAAAKVIPKKYFDGTFGRGGHTRALLNRYSDLKAVVCDWDEQAEFYCTNSFSEELKNGRLAFYRNSFHEFEDLRAAQPDTFSNFDFMLLDLGVSSPQIDQAERGFSFYQNGPLDMRMDRRREQTAADIVNTWSENHLLELFANYGEIQSPLRVVRVICNDRKIKPYSDTKDLADMIERVDGWQKKGSHPATRYFLALRMEVNQELELLAKSLKTLVNGLSSSGQLAVISFHSLEDRITKQTFNDLEDQGLGYRYNRKVTTPSENELKQNPRSRSAKLRIFQLGAKPDKYELRKQKKYAQDEHRGQHEADGGKKSI